MSFEEGFQTAGPLTESSAVKCDETAIQSFPLLLNFGDITNKMYEEVLDPLAIDFKWGARSTPPQFLKTEGNSNATDEVGEGQSNLTTFKYLGVEYQVNRVEIAASTHTAWILPTDKRVNNREDIVITFEKKQADSSARYRYIIFVIPIIRVESSIPDRDYIRGLRNSSATGPFSLESCFPANARSLFAYYSVCLNGIQGEYPIESAYVFVSTEGIEVSKSSMEELLIAYNPSALAFPDASPPFKNRFTSGKPPKALQKGEFGLFVLSTNQLLDAKGGGKIESRRDNLDAYKCVPLNPDANVESGNINIDLETGTPLNEVLAAREAEKNALGVAAQAEKGAVSLNPGRLEKIMSSAIGIFMAVLAGLGFILLISRYFGASGAASAAASGAASGPAVLSMGAKVAQVVQSSATYAIIIVLTGFLGFIIGVMLQ